LDTKKGDSPISPAGYIGTAAGVTASIFGPDVVNTLSVGAKAMEGATVDLSIQFGANENQSYHTFRHVVDGGRL
jgi:hypothetical protein